MELRQNKGVLLQSRSAQASLYNALLFCLAVGMTGSVGAATVYIGNLAVDAWERDLDRAVKRRNMAAPQKDL